MGSWAGEGGWGEEAAGVSVKVLVFSQNNVVQRFAEQIIDDDKVVDRVQRRFEEQDLDAPRVSLVQSGVGLVAPFSDVDKLLALSDGNLDIISTSSSSGRHSQR